jgi:hypothetical protein
MTARLIPDPAGPPPEGRAALAPAGRFRHRPRRSLGSPEGVQLPLIPVTVDRVPELTHYRDEGCRVWPSCLNCPLPRCIYDQPGGQRRQRTAARDEELRRQAAAGTPPPALAERYGLSQRQVRRILKACATPVTG